MTDFFTTVDGPLHTHARDACRGTYCCVHNPSKHHMVNWPLRWRSDRGLMERVCPHGVGHPDPDHLDFVRRVRGATIAEQEGIHGCDGCCGQHE